MKTLRIFCAFLVFVLCLGGCSAQKYDPETIVRVKTFDLSDTFDVFASESGQAKSIGLIIKGLEFNSSMSISPDKAEQFFTSEYAVNEAIANFDTVCDMLHAFDKKTEDLVCVTVYEHIPQLEGNLAGSCVFSVNRQSHNVKPELCFFAKDGVISDESYSSGNDALLDFFEYIDLSEKLVDAMKNTLYAEYN